jgi:capsular polysaccharide biosynthesis protein
VRWFDSLSKTLAGAANPQRHGTVREDLAVIKDRGARKLARLWKTAPMYLPARRPAGRSLQVVTGSGDRTVPDSIERHEALPRRTLFDRTGRAEELDPLYAFVMRPGCLITDGTLFHGYVAGDDRLVSEISVDYRGEPGAWPSFERLQRYPRGVSIPTGASLLTGGGGAAAYFHWLYDVLPRLHLLERSGLAGYGPPYITEKVDHEFKHTTLRLMGVDPADCIEVTGPVTIRADRLVATAGHRHPDHAEPWIPQFLRSTLMARQPETGLRIYVNRRDTKIRRILNESRLESALATRGFTSVTMSEHPFEEKVRLYASADVVVAPHGSGLSNIAFCPPGAHVVDIVGDDWSGPLFEDIARAVSLHYRAVPASRTVSSALLPDIVRHLDVDVDQVVAAVDEILD